MYLRGVHISRELGFDCSCCQFVDLINDVGWSGKACSTKKRDNLLVEKDIICHFRGLIFCNMKRLQFHQYIRNKKVVAQFS